MNKIEKDIQKSISNQMLFNINSNLLKNNLDFHQHYKKPKHNRKTIIKLSTTCLSIFLLMYAALYVSFKNPMPSNEKLIEYAANDVYFDSPNMKNVLTLSKILDNDRLYLYEVESFEEEYDYYIVQYFNCEYINKILEYNNYEQYMKDYQGSMRWVIYNEHFFPAHLEEKTVINVIGVKKVIVRQEVKTNILINKTMIYYEKIDFEIDGDVDCFVSKYSKEKRYLIGSSYGYKDIRRFKNYNDFFKESLYYRLEFEIEKIFNRPCIMIYPNCEVATLETKSYYYESKTIPCDILQSLISYRSNSNDIGEYFCYLDIINQYHKK